MALIAVLIALGAAYVGYTKARTFVKTKLRYVDAVQRSTAPLKAGVIATLVAMPVAWLLPVVTTASAVLFGTAVGFGVAAGRRELRRGVAVNA
jgi:hypothetical protein